MSQGARGGGGGASRGSRSGSRGSRSAIPTTVSFLAGCVPGTSVTLPDGSVLSCPGLVPSAGMSGLRDVEPDSGSPTGTGAQAPSGAGGFTSADRSTVRKSLAVIAALLAAWALGRSG